MPESQEEAPDDASTATQIPSNRGIVYVLTNQAMDNYVKVGRTSGNSSKDVLERMKQLDNTSVPLPFDCEYAAVVDNYEKVEQSLLTAFEDRRVPRREFLHDVAPHQLKVLLKLIEIDDVTPRGSDVVDVPPVVDGGRKPKFKFSTARVPVGATLQWADNPQITCRVEDDTHILYQGKRATISGVAKELKEWKAAQGSLYWLYEEVTLKKRLEQVEAEEEN